ncbi:hypothetical protein [Cellulosilyticum sp. I15G10I2]|uniref:PD-(D/E)XK nuclease domain-containing protein n=1 Tax=Cellulosilyticum sp. I15G10I2 TaxID=1892843 RepID=UPI00085BEFA1|nr:hypothetical protein [Cellulosilyticum sp. I15G10I2]
MKDILLDLQTLINKATLDYKNRTWLRYDIYCTQFNKLLSLASHYREINISPIEIASSQSLHNRQGSYEAYDMLAERVKLKEVVDKATSLLEKLNTFSPSVPMTAIDTISDVELVCNNFCSVVRELRRRSDHGTVLDIDTDGDILYLLKALLRLYFDAVYEDTNQSYDLNKCRSLLIPREKIALIVKKTHRSSTDKELLNDFLQAINSYSQTSDYTTLFYFIYDPELRISQPIYLENQLILLNNSPLTVKIFIRPLS